MSDALPPVATPPQGAERGIRYILVGGWNTVFGYLAFSAFYLLTQRLGISYLFATVPAQVVAPSTPSRWPFRRRESIR